MTQNLKVPKSIEPYIAPADKNLSRVKNLIELYVHHFGKGKGRKGVNQTDILRSAVVLLHATLEDFLRSISATYLPQSSETVLNGIPLIGFIGSGRPEKFFLGKLLAHKGKTIDQVIEESVEKYLESTNFNDTTEISALLASLGIDVSKVNSSFNLLQKMIERRHQIVHRADRNNSGGKGRHFAQSLKPTQVINWLEATKDFMAAVLIQIYKNEEGSKQPTI